MKARPYQREAIEKVLAYAADHPTGRLLLVIPPRGGKTLVGAMLALTMAVRHGLRVLWLAHRTELVDQAVEHLIEAGVHAGSIGIIQGRRATNPEGKVQVACDATLDRRNIPVAHLVISDESHRDTATRRRRLRRLFPKAFHLGLSATPKPPPTRDLGEDYDALMVVVQPSELIHDGFLAVPTVYAPARENIPDLRALRVVDGDYRPEDLEGPLMRERLLDDQVREWGRLAEGRATISFPVTIAHSRALVDRFVAAGVKAVHLDGSTAPQERRRTLADLAEGRVPVVCSVAVLSEGVNIPRVKCVLGVRPTRMLTLWIQQSMRCATPWGSAGAQVLDAAGNVYVHGYPFADRSWSLKNAESGLHLGGQGAVKRCRCGAVMPAQTKVCSACSTPFPETEVEIVVPEAELHLQAVLPTASKMSEEGKRLLAYAMYQRFSAPEAWVQHVLDAKYGAKS